MSKTVVAIEEGLGDSITIKLIQALGNFDDPFKPHAFDCPVDNMPDWGTREAVKNHGIKIMAALREHPAVEQAFQSVLQSHAAESQSIHFQITVPEVEQLFWEGIYDEHSDRFLALNRQIGIARVTKSLEGLELPTQTYQGPLRIMAVLSAIGIPAQPQWEGLRAAAEQARADGLDLRLAVMAGERDLVATIQALQLDWVEVHAAPARSSGFEDIVSSFDPHIVHFFCHGKASHGVSELEIGTANSFDHQDSSEALHLDTRSLAQFFKMTQPWMVVLNSCLGAQSTENSYSMAYDLVAEGVPAAVGMLERLDARDAHRFCGAFYPSLFTKVREAIHNLNGNTEVPLEWAETLFNPRRDISQQHGNNPKDDRQWLLPVLYVRPESFRLRSQPPDLSATQMQMLQWKVKSVAGMLQMLANAPAEAEGKRDQLLAMLDDVPEFMRPDRFGRFPDE